MSATNSQDAARHESGHATALAVRTGILTDNLFVGCRPDGSYAAGINDASRIPLDGMTAANWIIYNFAGHAAERLFNPNTNRNAALGDDITAEKVLRVSFRSDFWVDALDLAQQITDQLVQTHRKCIQELADAILAIPPRTATVLGDQYHIHRLEAPQIAEILRNNGIQTSRQFGSPDADAMFDKVLERYVAAIRFSERSPILATEFRNWRRFSEMNFLSPTTPRLNHQMWLDTFGKANAEIEPTLSLNDASQVFLTD
jgi:hypothetical protein